MPNAKLISEPTKVWLAELVYETSVRRVAVRFNLADATILRAVAGFGVQPATARLLESEHHIATHGQIPKSNP